MDIKITDIIDQQSIALDLHVKDKNDALLQLIDLIGKSGKVTNIPELRRVILERERLMSTGIGNGVALPHGKTSVVSSSIAAIATLHSPIDFDALDDKPVQIILLLVGTEGNVGIHLRLLSRISRLVGSDSFRASLLGARTVEEVMQLFASYEEERV